jgi:ATP-dependent helicase/nuclease subunit B
MPISRKFLGWHQPPLLSTIDFLVERYQSARSLDLSEVQIVVPGSRAGRRLLEMLVGYCDAERLRLLPPIIDTVGQFPERLYEPKLPFANDLVQQLAWVHVLRGTSRSRLEYLIPDVPETDDFARWREVANLISRIHRELAAECLDFAGVLDGPWKGGGDERSRWKLLASLQRRYLTTLDSLELWDQQTARLFAIEHAECQSKRDIVVVGAADMPRSLRRMLDQVSPQVTTLVFAPLEYDEWFDEHGCIVSSRWAEVDFDLPFDRVRVAGGPNDQVEEVVRTLERLSGKYAADEITIASPDAKLTPQLERRFRQLGLPTRNAAGVRVSDSTPVRLLVQLAAYLDGGRFQEFSGLIRHPDLFQWLSQRVEGDWLRQLDEYYVDHLQPELGRWLGPASRYELILAVDRHMQQWLDPVIGMTRRLCDWAVPLMESLRELYGEQQRDLDSEEDQSFVESFRRIQTALVQWQAVPVRLAPRISASEAVQLLVDGLSGESISPPDDESAIEILGWLEMALDTSPVRVITSFNEGMLPTSVTNDLFLPDGLRRSLQLVDNQRRFARDAYAANVVFHSCAESTWIVGRRDSHGDPLMPSRLLFATDDDQVAKRVTAILEAEVEDTLHSAASGMRSMVTQFRVPRPRPLESPIESMNVTAFRAYLACPYRFYLRYVLGLDRLDDRAKEMDGRSFGNLLHRVLNMFGESDAKDEIRREKIEKYLHSALSIAADSVLGSRRRAPVNVQLKQMEIRLTAFADWQARRREKGWEIAFVEEPRCGEVFMDSGPYRMEIRGRIDRIDRHRDTGQWAILDYKSSDRKQAPARVHRRGDRWVDLQLPLYRHIAAPLGVTANEGGEVLLGYVLLPKDTKEVGEVMANWTPGELLQADQVAKDVIAGVRDERFWPPKSDISSWFDDYATICQEGVFERERFASDPAMSTEEFL